MEGKVQKQSGREGCKNSHVLVYAKKNADIFELVGGPL
jgi:hypothetical protein